MKPKTKLQKLVDELRVKLPVITEKQRRWALSIVLNIRGIYVKRQFGVQNAVIHGNRLKDI